MKRLGIIGGLGPESTVDYYQTIIALYRERKPDGSYPHLLINSIDLEEGRAFIERNDLGGLTRFLLQAIEQLARAGCDFGLMAANTPHLVFDQVASQSPVPLISVVEASCAEMKRRGLRRLCLFGTRYTMQADFYARVFARENIELIAPSPSDQDYIHEKYFGELVPGIFLPETRAGLLAIVDRMRESVAIDGLLLAGTELSLILREPEHDGIPVVDTAAIHCEAAVKEMFRS
jgi:aspartate racemase